MHSKSHLQNINDQLQYSLSLSIIFIFMVSSLYVNYINYFSLKEKWVKHERKSTSFNSTYFAVFQRMRLWSLMSYKNNKNRMLKIKRWIGRQIYTGHELRMHKTSEKEHHWSKWRSFQKCLPTLYLLCFTGETLQSHDEDITQVYLLVQVYSQLYYSWCCHAARPQGVPS